MSKIGLSLSTTVNPPEVFTVDGDEFKLLGLEHLSADAENEIMALFARHGAVSSELNMGLPVDKGKLLADRLKKIQNEIIRLMTTIPKDIIETLPMLEKARLFEAVQEKYEAKDDQAAGSEESGDVPAAAASGAGDL